MEFGMFHQFPALPGRSEREAFEEAFAQIDAAERWGLDVMWLAELHFDPQRSVLSAPLSIASAVAARTNRIKIGIAVQVLPLCHPLRIAEEGATVDQISGGRLIFGVGRSGLPRTYEDYGVSYAESRDRFLEVLDIVAIFSNCKADSSLLHGCDSARRDLFGALQPRAVGRRHLA